MEDHDDTRDDDELPKILLCGWGRCGKTSIYKTVFNMMCPPHSRFLPSTREIEHTIIDRNCLVRFEIVEFPGTTVFDDPSVNRDLFEKAGAVVVVIDYLDTPFTRSLVTARKVIEQIHAVNKRVSFDILIHKVEGERNATPDAKTEIQRSIHGQLTEGLDGRCQAQMQFHCTNIQDHSIFEAMSKVAQRLIPNQTPVLQEALNHLVKQSKFEKAYLFDMSSKVYVSSDSRPVDLDCYEFSANLIDVAVATYCIYNDMDDSERTMFATHHDPHSSTILSLDNGRLLYLREVDKCLAVVCIMMEENFEKQFLIDYNIEVFREALVAIFRVPTNPISPGVSSGTSTPAILAT